MEKADMESSKNVLLVTNSLTESEIILVKEAIHTAYNKNLRIKLSLVHVIPNLPSCYFNIPSMIQLAERYYDEAKQCLNHAGYSLGVHKKDQWLITGRIKTEVLRLADKLNSHFILASSVSIQDLHRSFLFKRENQRSQIRNINHINCL